jgi:hypothetical protein
VNRFQKLLDDGRNVISNLRCQINIAFGLIYVASPRYGLRQQGRQNEPPDSARLREW